MRKLFVRRGVGLLLLLLIPASALGQTARDVEEAFWRSVECEYGPEVELYLEIYPRGAYVAEAWACLEEQRAAEEARRQWRAGQTFRDALRSGGQGPQLVIVPAESYQMGDSSEGPVHRVTIGQPFAVGVYEVTFAEWEACVRGGGCNGYRPDDEGWGRGRRPVIGVNWADAQAYGAWLSRQTGKPYRLLSEAEWEYVARAGTTTQYWWGEEIGRNRANCSRCGSQWDNEKTAPVGSFGSNAFGLYNVHGNVWEWVQDCWNESYTGAPSDGRAWERGDCSRRVLRGGCWNEIPWIVRSAKRLRGTAGKRDDCSGFRIARSLP